MPDPPTATSRSTPTAVLGLPRCPGVPTYGYVVSGRMHIKMDDGTEADVGPGDVFVCPPGHDAWIVGNEACEVFDFAGASTYAKKG